MQPMLIDDTHLFVEVDRNVWSASRNWLSYIIPAFRPSNSSTYGVYVIHIETAIKDLTEAASISKHDAALHLILMDLHEEFPEVQYLRVGRK